MTAIQNTSVSFSEIYAGLLAYVQSKPNYESYWKDFYASGAGTTMLELIASLAVYENFAIDSSRRDTYLQECRLRSSAVAISNNSGYSAGRGNNPTYTLTFTPSVGFNVAEFDTVGTYKSAYSLISKEAKSFSQGVQSTIDVTIGQLSSEIVVVPSADLQPFRFTSSNVSSDYKLELNGSVLPVSAAFSDLASDAWVAISNPFGAVDAFYANNDPAIVRTHTYATGDTLVLTFIELDETLTSISTSDLALTLGAVTVASEISELEHPERLDSIRVNSPLHADVQHVIRSRFDFPSFFATTVPNLVHTALQDDPANPYEHKITYVKDDLELLTAGEVAQFQEDLEPRRPLGVMPAIIVDPVAVVSELTILVYLNAGTTISTAEVDTDLQALWYDRTWKLGVDWTSGALMADLESDAEKNISYIKTIRLTSDAATPLAWNEYSIPTNTITLN